MRYTCIASLASTSLFFPSIPQNPPNPPYPPPPPQLFLLPSSTTSLAYTGNNPYQRRAGTLPYSHTFSVVSIYSAPPRQLSYN